MSIELSQDPKTGVLRFSYKRHVYVALGLLLVGNGLLTFTGPWWQGLLEALLGKVDVRVESSYQWAIGGVQVVIGLALLAYKHFVIDERQARLDADKLTIKKSDLGIERVRQHLDCLVDDHSYKSSLQSHFYEIHTRFSRPELSFQNKETATLYRKFSSLGAKLENFVGANFFVFPNGRPADGDYRYCLAPHLNMDRDLTFYDPSKIAEYDSLKLKLHALVKETNTAFSLFITNLKEHGHL